MARRAWYLAGVLLALLLAVFAAWRERLSRFGATDVEVIRELPGDNIGVSRRQHTRAVTIDAPAEVVWPWIAQLGRDRAGSYLWPTAEYLLDGRSGVCDRIHPEWQEWKEGDTMALHSARHGVRATAATLRLIRPREVLVVATTLNGQDEGTFAFILEPIDAHHTRLIVRNRVLTDATLTPLLYDPIQFALERKMMSSIKRRAEGYGAASRSDSAEVLGFLLTVQALFVAMILALRPRTAQHGLVAVAVLGVALSAVTFMQPGGVISLGVGAGAIAWLVVPILRVLRAPPRAPSEAPGAAT